MVSGAAFLELEPEIAHKKGIVVLDKTALKTLVSGLQF